MRKKIVAANWKMNLTQAEAENYWDGLLKNLREVDGVEIVLIPSFTSLPVLASRLDRTQPVQLGAQNMHWEAQGAFTGEISAGMLRALQVKYVIIGHSERRQLFGETDAIITRKVRAALQAGLRPILCVGETLAQRKNEEVEKVLEYQLRQGLAGATAKDLGEVVVAYEPLWAIGSGQSATPQHAQKAHESIRAVLASLGGSQVADQVRIQYGGSVKPENAAELMRQRDIDGALVGGASLEPGSFAQIVRATETVTGQ